MLFGPHALLGRGGPAPATLTGAADFDGVNDFLSRTTDLAGAADGKTMTVSVWVYRGDTNDCAIQLNRNSGGSSLNRISQASNAFAVDFGNGSGGNVLIASVTSPTMPLNAWQHVLMSVDMSSTSLRSIYINDTAATVSWGAYSNANLVRVSDNIGIGARSDGALKFKGKLAHLYTDYTYRDLSITANRRLFYAGALQPADNQAALSPILYLPMTTAGAMGVNLGTGGNFTVNGTL